MLKLELTLNELDYKGIVMNYLPKVLDGLREKNEKIDKLVKTMEDNQASPSALILNLLNGLSKEQLDNIITEGGKIYSEDIVELINGILKKQEIGVEVNHVGIQKV